MLLELSLQIEEAGGFAPDLTTIWKWRWCLGAALRGMGLSRQMNENFDLAWVIAIHWVATCLNTPRLPGRPSRKGRSAA